MALNEVDIALGERDPQNSPLVRSWRIVNTEIEKLEEELSKWRFVRDVMFREMELAKVRVSS
jgi:hypothetical protein